MKNKGFKWIAVLLIVEVSLLLFIMINFKVQSKGLVEGDIESFNEGWTLSINGEKVEDIDTLPYKCDSTANSEIILSNVIPSRFAGKTMYFYTADKPICVYIDGECVYEFGMKDERPFGKSPGAIINYVDIPANLKEGNISIVSTPAFDNVGTVFDDIKVADRDVAVLRLLSENIFELICSIIMFVTAFVLFVCGLTSFIFKEDIEGTFYMAVFGFTAGLYFLIQSRLMLIFYGNTLAYMQVNFTFLMHMPILMAAYYRDNFDRRFRKRFNIIIVIGIVNVFVQQAAYISNLFEYRDMSFLSQTIIALGAFVTIHSFGEMLKTSQRKQALIGMIAVITVFTGSIIDIIRAYSDISSDMGKYSRLTTVIYCFILEIYHLSNLLRRYNRRLKENADFLEKENMELLKAKNEAEMAKQDAIAANSAKNSFLARISHEIRTPINAVLGMDSMILRESKDNTIKGYAIDIKNAGNTLLSLINDILDFSKMESGNLEVIPVEYDLCSMLHDIINMVEPRIITKNLKLNVEVDENIPSRLFGDDVRVRQIIINILTNAVKYTEEGSVTFTVKCKSLDSQKVIISVDVTDTGIGIKDEDLENITVAFKRIEESRNRHIEGTGLGMNITVSLLSMMGSELKVKSVYGEGSSFGFDLEQGIVDSTPVGKFQERISKRAENVEYTVSVYAPKANVLVVDDNAMNLKVFNGLLKHTGVQITSLDSGFEAMDAIQKKHFDVIFMDHMMPQLDGIETLERMNKMEHQCKDTPVIVLTANAVVGAKEMYLEKGFEDFLSKPIIPEKLEQMLIKYLPEELKEDVKNIPKPKVEATISIDDFPKIEGIDWEIARDHFTDIEYLIEAVTNLYNTIENDIALTQKYYEDIDNEETLNLYRIKVHAMKSSSAIIGAITVSQLAKLLEYAARDKDFDTIHRLQPVFVRECNKLKAALDENRPEEAKDVADKQLLITLFKQLKKKVEELDIDAMDDVVAEINKYDTSFAGEAMKQLLNDVSNFDMESIIADADKIIGMI